LLNTPTAASTKRVLGAFGVACAHRMATGIIAACLPGNAICGRFTRLKDNALPNAVTVLALTTVAVHDAFDTGTGKAAGPFLETLRAPTRRSARQLPWDLGPPRRASDGYSATDLVTKVAFAILVIATVDIKCAGLLTCFFGHAN